EDAIACTVKNSLQDALLISERLLRTSQLLGALFGLGGSAGQGLVEDLELLPGLPPLRDVFNGQENQARPMVLSRDHAAAQEKRSFTAAGNGLGELEVIDLAVVRNHLIHR